MNVKILEPFHLDLCAAALAEWPDDSAPWVIYDSAIEKKRALNDWRHIGQATRTLLRRMLLLDAGGLLGLDPPLLGDALLWGAGLHETTFLDLHLDSDRHPLWDGERRANAILFLHDGEGDLQFPGVKVSPKAGRLVLFECDSVHGVPMPGHRRSLACYWWGEPRGESKRPRAVFLPGEHDTEEKRHARARR